MDLYYFLLISLLLNTLLISIAIYLFKWRKILNDTQTSIIPSELLSEFTKNQSHLSNLSIVIDKFKKTILKSKTEDSEVIKEIQNYLSILRENTLKTDEEISRLREGYDTKIFKDFLNRFFRVYRIIEEDLEYYKDKNEEPFIKLLNDLKISLKEAFLDCGLEEFSPKKGEEYKKAFGVSENIVSIETTVESENMKIAKIKSSGFKVKNDYGYKVMKPAIVTVYKYKKEGI